MFLEIQELSQVTEITSRGEPLFPKATNVNKPNLKEMKGKETKENIHAHIPTQQDLIVKDEKPITSHEPYEPIGTYI